MKDIFWKNVSKVNASLIMIFSLVLLIASVIWISRPRNYGVMRFGVNESSTPEDVQNEQSTAWRGKYLENIEDVAVDTANIPFASKYLQEKIAQRKLKESLAKAEKGASGNGSSKGKEAKGEGDSSGDSESTEKNEPEPPREMKLIYRGMLTKLDGSRLALVDLPAQNKTKYYQQGERIGWTEIAEFSPRHMRLTGDGSDYTLRRGVEKEIVEGGE